MFRNPLIDAIVILVIVLLIMGPKRLPELGKGLGRGMREFKDGITGDSKETKDQTEIPSTPPSANPPSPTGTQQERESAEVGSERQS